MIGTVVGNKYRILRRLGAGGMGTVYAATHAHTGRAVALKLLSKDLGADAGSATDPSDTLRARYDELLERFKREALAAGSIKSEYVVQILDAGQTGADGLPFLVMEMLEGETVQNICKKIGAIEPRAAISIAAQVCQGLVDAHAAGIIHRDIKSANLIVSKNPNGEAVTKILDFGIAKVLMDEFQASAEAGLTRTGNMLGSPQYMSPEQARGLKSIDFRADLWSLGVVLYRMLSGSAPFNQGPLGQVLLAICTEPPPPLRARAPWVKSSVEAIVMRALEKEPARRFASAQAMLDALLAELPSRKSKLEYDAIVPPSKTQREIEPLPAFDAPTSNSTNTASSANSANSATASTGNDTVTKMTMDTRRGFDEEILAPKRSRATTILAGAVVVAVAVAGVAYWKTSGFGAAQKDGANAATAEPTPAGVASATPNVSVANEPAHAQSSEPPNVPPGGASSAPAALPSSEVAAQGSSAQEPPHPRVRGGPRTAKNAPAANVPTPASPPPASPPPAAASPKPNPKSGVGATNSFD